MNRIEKKVALGYQLKFPAIFETQRNSGSENPRLDVF